MINTLLFVSIALTFQCATSIKDGFCVPIQNPEPSQCPKFIGPPCPRCYNNTMPDYSPGDVIDVKSLAADIQRQIKNFTTIILRDAPPNENTSDTSISNGLSGRAYLFMRLAEYETDPKQKQVYMNYAKQYLTAAQAKFPSTPTYPSFLVGNVGGYAISAVMAHKNNDQATVDKYIALIKEQFDLSSAANSKIDLDACAFFPGQAGLVMTGLFINNYFQQRVISSQAMMVIIQRIIKVGIKYSNGNGLRWNGVPFSEPTCFPYGMAEGSGGILDVILKAGTSWVPEVLENVTIVNLLADTIDYLVTLQYPDGNMPTPVCRGSTPGDIEVQWCHGAPGFVSFFGNAYSVFRMIDSDRAQKYLTAAQRASDAMWARGLLTKGLLFCHGVGGNAYMFLDLYRYTDDMKQAWRAYQFIKWALDPYHVSRVRAGDTPNAMFEGQHSVVMLFSEMQKPGWPMGKDYCMPGFTPCF